MNSKGVAEMLEQAHENFGHDELINIVDPIMNVVVNEPVEHNGSCTYVNYYDGSLIARFEYGKLTHFGLKGDDELFRAMERIHWNLWNVLTKPDEPKLVDILLDGESYPISKKYTNKETVDYFTAGGRPLLLASISGGVVNDIVSGLSVTILAQILADYTKESA